MSARRWLWAAAALALAAAGCDESKGPPDTSDAPRDGRWWVGGAGGTGHGLEETVEKVDAELLANVRRILADHCAPCHSGREDIAQGGLGDIFDAQYLSDRGIIFPGKADASPLYLQVAEGEMPPAGATDPLDASRAIAPVSPEDLAHLAAWLNLGAPALDVPRVPLTGLELRELMAADAAALPAAELPFYRYVSLSAFHDSQVILTAELDMSVNAVSMLFTSLSPSRAESPPPPKVLLNARYEPVAMRLDLRDYELDAADWARLEGAAEVIDRQAFPCKVPFLGVDQLFSLGLTDQHVRADGGVESVYSNIVLRRFLERAGVLGPGQLVFEPKPGGEPAEPLASTVTLPQLASALGVDLKADIAAGGEAALRLCSAQVSAANQPRCVQRDTMPGGLGRGFWWTMNFAPEPDGLPASPIGPANGGLVPPTSASFDLTEGVALWPWPNGAPGFAVFGDDLRLRSMTATYQYFEDGSGESFGFATCPYCHSAGPAQPYDQMRPALDSGDTRPGGFTPAEIAFVDRLFRPESEVFLRVQEDTGTFFEGDKSACVRGCGSPSRVNSLSVLGPLTIAYLTTLTTDQAALGLYLDTPTFSQILAADPATARALYDLKEIPRANFVRTFDALRRAAIAAGVDEAALNFCAVPEGG